MDHPPLKPLTWDMIQGNVVIICQLLIINVVMLVVLTWGTDMWWLGESSAWRKLLFILSPGIRRTWLTYKKEERDMHVLLFWIVMESRSVHHRVWQNFWLSFLFQNLLVTGGIGSGNHLSSTEIYQQSTWSYAASLPSPRSGLSAANVENSVFVFGKRISKFSMEFKRWNRIKIN